MQHGLFEILTGSGGSATGPASLPNGADRARSIRDHLDRLLNARQGALAHMPDYGLPDLAQLYQGLPYTLDRLAAEVRRTILRYEPRLEEVAVVPRQRPRGAPVLHIDIHATIRGGGTVRFRTLFLSGGQARVLPAPGGRDHA